MSKNRIITILIACAIVFIGLACYFIYHYMSPQRETIYIFNSTYSAGDTFEGGMVTPVQVDASAVTNGKSADSIANHFVTAAELASVIRSGDSLKINVTEGMPLTTAMLSVTGGSTIEMNMPSDSVAVSISVDSIEGVTNDLKEGSHVNIYYTNGDVTVLIQQNKRILEVFKDNGKLSGVAIEEDIRDSMELVNAVNTGRLYLGLVDSTGYQASKEDNPSFSFVNQSGAAADAIDFNNYLNEASSYYENETEAAASADNSVTGGIEPDEN